MGVSQVGKGANRKQRRIAASKKGQKKMGVEVQTDKRNLKPGEASPFKPAPLQRGPVEDPAEKQERLQKLVSGRITPPNEMVRYFVDQLRQVFAETDAVNKQLQQHRAAATQAENRVRELLGMRNKYLDDIRHWDKEPEQDAAKKGEAA